MTEYTYRAISVLEFGVHVVGEMECSETQLRGNSPKRTVEVQEAGRHREQ